MACETTPISAMRKCIENCATASQPFAQNRRRSSSDNRPNDRQRFPQKIQQNTTIFLLPFLCDASQPTNAVTVTTTITTAASSKRPAAWHEQQTDAIPAFNLLQFSRAFRVTGIQIRFRAGRSTGSRPLRPDWVKAVGRSRRRRMTHALAASPARMARQEWRKGNPPV